MEVYDKLLGDGPLPFFLTLQGSDNKTVCAAVRRAVKARFAKASGEEGINPEAVKDLLEACEKIVEYRDRSGPLSFQLEKADYFFEMARKAIAKANGEEVPA